MTRKQAIKILKWIAEIYDNKNTVYENQALTMAIEAIEEKQAGGWISVDERLPKTEGQLIWVALANGDVRKCQWQGRTHELDPWYDVSENVWFADIVVTHWQPLPEPPKEESL